MDQEIRLDPTTEDMLLDIGAIEPSIVEFRVAEEALPKQRGLLNAARWQLAVKRGMDIVMSGLALVVLTPLLLAVALLVGVTSRGPIFYVQERVGRSGKPFRMLKFRSMYRDAHDRRFEHVEQNMHQGPIFKIRDDPRITPVGRAIRRLSIDELPQFFNVLLGHMSLVGPRPPLPEEFLDYTDRERQRLLVKPGRDVHLAGERPFRHRLQDVDRHGPRVHRDVVGPSGSEAAREDRPRGAVRPRRLLNALGTQACNA